MINKKNENEVVPNNTNGEETKSVERIDEDLPQNDPLQRKPDLKRIRELIEWDNLTDAEDGISKTITYFKSLNEE